MPLDQGRERQLGRLAALGREPFQELTVRQLPDRPQVEHGSELPLDGPVRSDRHEFTLRPARLYPSPLMIVMPLACRQIELFRKKFAPHAPRVVRAALTVIEPA